MNIPTSAPASGRRLPSTAAIIAFLCLGLPAIGFALFFATASLGSCTFSERDMQARCAEGVLHAPLLTLTWAAVYAMASVLLTPLWLLLGLLLAGVRKLWELAPDGP